MHCQTYSQIQCESSKRKVWSVYWPREKKSHFCCGCVCVYLVGGGRMFVLILSLLHLNISYSLVRFQRNALFCCVYHLICLLWNIKSIACNTVSNRFVSISGIQFKDFVCKSTDRIVNIFSSFGMLFLRSVSLDRNIAYVWVWYTSVFNTKTG